MLDVRVDGRLQIMAATSLLTESKLVKWGPASCYFVAAEHYEFESALSNTDPVFGRLKSWILFSTGAEFLGKGVLLMNEIDFRKRKPDGSTDFKTLQAVKGHLDQLSKAKHSTADEGFLLKKGFRLLADAARNRDVHGYVPNVRDAQFHLVAETFVPCFNLLVEWLPDGSGTLNTWSETAASFIASL